MKLDTSIQWVMCTDDRFQGIIELIPGMKICVMLIKVPYSHWCGYFESPVEAIPGYEERRIMAGYTKPDITYFGPSGPTIGWLILDTLTMDPRLKNTYWIGFDLESNKGADAYDAERLLRQFVESFFQGYLA